MAVDSSWPHEWKQSRPDEKTNRRNRWTSKERHTLVDFLYNCVRLVVVVVVFYSKFLIESWCLALWLYFTPLLHFLSSYFYVLLWLFKHFILLHLSKRLTVRQFQSLLLLFWISFDLCVCLCFCVRWMYLWVCAYLFTCAWFVLLLLLLFLVRAN